MCLLIFHKQHRIGVAIRLGYFPGIVQRLQVLDEQHKRLLADNHKLYVDNRDLAQLVALQNGRLAAMSDTDLNKVAYVESLQRELTSLRDERAALIHRDNAILGGLTPEQGYQIIYADLQRLRNEHTAALAEMERLRYKVSAYESMYGVMDGRKKSASAATARSASQPGVLPGPIAACIIFKSACYC